MPIYQYRCRSCGHSFEVKRSFSDSAPVSCPRCQGEASKVFQPVPIIYKCGGFYSTDHRPTSWKSEEAKDKADTGARAEEKAEAKG